MKKNNIIILTWNIGKYGNFLLNYYIEDLYTLLSKKKYPDHILINLQEAPNNFKENFKIDPNSKFSKKYSLNNIVISKSYVNNFSLVTIYFVKKGLKNLNYELTNTENNKLRLNNVNSKQVVIYEILENNKLLFYIANIHSAFGTKKEMLKSLNNIDEFIKSYGNTETPFIIAGDFNSRSYEVDKDKNIIFTKDVSLCNDEMKKLYMYCQLDEKNLDTKIKIIPNLLKNDILLKLMKYSLIFINYKEGLINFLPTYKINPVYNEKIEFFELEKKYKQSKGDKGRLTGYPDRVLVNFNKKRGKIVDYDSLILTGNDHLPVYCYIELFL
jgi:endonuclease/exonuclease/phosphatase family metal-dependent hydrolase